MSLFKCGEDYHFLLNKHQLFSVASYELLVEVGRHPEDTNKFSCVRYDISPFLSGVDKFSMGSR